MRKNSKKISAVILTVIAIVATTFFAACAADAAKYVATFGGEGITTFTSETYDYLEEPAVPERDGYSFDGWFEENAESSFDFNKPLTSNVKLTAKWTKIHAVTFVPDNGEKNLIEKVKDGEIVQKPNKNPEKSGFVFEGWLKGENEYDFSAAVTEDLTLTAKYAEECRVSFVTGTSVEIPSIKIGKGSVIEKPQVVLYKEKHDFICWQTEDGSAYDFNAPITGNLTLTAVWKKFCSVSYKWADGHNTDIITKKVYVGEKAEDWRATELVQWATVAIYWYTTDAENPYYVDDVLTPFDFDTPITEDITLYTYLPNYRTSWVLPEEATYDKTNPFKVETGGQSFNGTFKFEEDCLHFVVPEENSGHTNMLELNQMALPYNEADMKFLKLTYANAGKDTVLRLMVVTAEGEGLGVYDSYHSVLKAETNDAYEEAYARMPVADGKTIVFIRLEFVSAVGKIDNDGTDIRISKIALVDEANYGSRTVSFVTPEGAEDIAPKQVKYGEKVVLPDVPTMEGYDFVGWFKDENLTISFDENKEIFNDVTLYAKFNEKAAVYFTVTFNENNGTEKVTRTVGENTAVDKPADPRKTDAEFIGWYLGNELYDFANPITSDVELTAKYRTCYVVTYAFADEAGTVIETRKIYPDGKTVYAEDFRYTGDLTYRTQAHYWYAAKDLAVRYNFNTHLESSLTLYTFVELRSTYTAKELSYNPAENPFRCYADASKYQINVNEEKDYIEYKVEADVANAQLDTSITGGVAYSANTRYFKIKYKNLSADKYIRIWAYDMNTAPHFIQSEIKSNMTEDDDWATVTFDMNGVSGFAEGIAFNFLRFDFVSDAAMPADTDGTHILIREVGLVPYAE